MKKILRSDSDEKILELMKIRRGDACVVKPVNFQEFVAPANKSGVFGIVLNEPPVGSIKRQKVL